MAELKTLSKYPFLNESKRYVKENKLSVIELLSDPVYERARVFGVERLDNAFDNKDVGERNPVTETDCIMELLSYPIARMIAVCINDLYFKRRYALGEAVHTYKNLVKEETSFILDVAKEFDFNVKHDEETKKISIHFKDYLKNAPTRYKSWKMINHPMKNGFVFISKRNLVRLIQESLRNRINEELDQRQCNQVILDTFKNDIKRIRKKVNILRKKMEAEPVGELKIGLLPPCMKNILGSIQNGENVPHMGRFAIVSFLHSLGLDTNQILKIFSTAPDFEEEKSRYQVEHIAGDGSTTSYKPPSCEKLKTYGLCPTEEMDAICKRVYHPMSYYRYNWKKNKNKKTKEKKKQK